MLRDNASLLDIYKAGSLIQEFISGIDRTAFLKDEKTQSAVLHQILVLGEATKRVSAVYREAHPEVPWRLMAGMRDVVIHAYESVDLAEVWHTAISEIPILLEKIKPLLPKK